MNVARVVGVGNVRKAVSDHLQLWFPWTLPQVARGMGCDPAAIQPRSWHRLANLADAREDQLPMVAVSSPGLADRPHYRDDFTVDASWTVFVSLAVRGQSYEETADLVGLYVTTARVACIQHGSLSGFAIGTTWIGENYDPVVASAAEGARTLGSASVELAVRVAAVTDLTHRPDIPPDPSDDYDLPTFDSVVLDIEPLPPRYPPRYG